MLEVLRQVSFQQDPIQVLSASYDGSEITFPLMAGPINFSILSRRGMSVRWGVRVDSKGDAYIYNREVKNAEHVSLHMSGDQHIAFTRRTAALTGSGNRFGPRWTEPAIDQNAVPTFSILFPPWGDTARHPKDLAKKGTELLIVGHAEKVLVVGFFIMESGTELRVHTPHFVLGKLALRPGKVLHVVAWKEPERNMKDKLRSSLKRISAPLTKHEQLVLNLQGFRAPQLRLHGVCARPGNFQTRTRVIFATEIAVRSDIKGP